MPGIYGYFKSKNKNKNKLKNMTKQLLHQWLFIKSEDVIDEDIEMSHIHLGKMKVEKKCFFKDGVYIAIEGEQYDFKKSNFEDLLFNAYIKNKLEFFLNQLDGYFHAIIYDYNLKKAFLISDRYGMRMLYFYFKDGMFAFCSEVKGLLALDFVDNEIDEKQINCFIDLGYLVEDNTYHKYIKLIKPASIMEFDITSKSLTHRYYWKWSEIKSQNMTFENAVEKLGHLFINAIDKRFEPNKKIGVALSGGLDSRAIFAAVDRLYPNIKGYAYTFGLPNCDDITIAKKCVAKTNWDHKEFYFSSNNWFKPRKEKVWFTDGMLNMMHMHGSEFLDEINKNIDFNLNGYGGDVVLGGGFFNAIPMDTRASKSNLVKFYKNHTFLCDVEDDFYEIDKCEPHLYMNRVRRFTNMGTVNGLIKVDQRKPFFDNELIEFVYSLPDKYRENNKLYSAMLLKFFPDFFKDIPWQNTGKTIDKKISNSFISMTLRKVKRIPVKLKLFKENKSYTNYPLWLKDEKLSYELLQLLDRERSEYSKYINDDFKNKYLVPHLIGGKDHSEKILRAATIELYLIEANNY